MTDWFEYILFQMRSQPQRPAIVLMDRVVTYGMLASGMEHCARRLTELNLGRDDVVAITVRNPVRQMILSLALLRIGVASTVLDPSLVHHMKVAVVLGESDAPPQLGAAYRSVAVTNDWFVTSPPTARPLPAGFADPQSICRVGLTSGSTGLPKVVPETVASLGVRVLTFGRLAVANNCRVLSQFNLSMIFGLVIGCTVLASGGTLYFAESSGQAASMIELFNIDAAVLSTEQLLALATTARRTGVRLTGLRRVVSGGTVSSRTLLEVATTHVCKDILCWYGATEVRAIACAPVVDVLAHPGLVGFVMPGIDVGIYEGEQQLPAGQVGVIKVRHRTDPPGGGASSRWIDIGDRGWLDGDGRLFMVGRTSETAAGQAGISPVHEAEHILRLEFDMDDAAVAEMPDPATGKPQLWIGVVNNRDATPHKVQAALARRGMTHAIRLFVLPFVPRGVSGKINRDQLKAALLTRSPTVAST
jgi:acyl-coenzyme A synthetase/AMP-(fatty) acid ligase